MSIALQIALFTASVAIVVLVVWIIVITCQARRQLNELAQMAEKLKSDVHVFVQHSEEMVREVTDVTKRASEQLDEVREVVRTVHRWTVRTDRIVNEIGSAIEPPVFSLVRNANAFRHGVVSFVLALLERNQHNRTNQLKEEEDHV